MSHAGALIILQEGYHHFPRDLRLGGCHLVPYVRDPTEEGWTTHPLVTLPRHLHCACVELAHFLTSVFIETRQ